ncbi:bile acid:sodium symporter family protein [Actinomyces massiliensis]|uniref:Sodium Bile acid symporter family protein n=1 Tax=Actinomyces massiliensis F0489 TaxID=1125718 RepID=J0NGS4_9ACTO|nr:bile acid:sodium symporter family protein [Actinomyces massiliensis]EJF46264.1 sodium Bile acid symporter family protein [Actinomyces massiliensis F0489]WLD71111.1 bile acid:sodium symporter family protein [Actinomyces massiliensis]
MTAPESQNSHSSASSDSSRSSASSASSASSDSSRSSASSDPGAEDRSARTAVTVFPVLILAAFAVALLVPTQLSPLSAGTNYALGIIMFGMGLTLTPPDFALVVKRPLPVLVGVVAQFVIMPTLAWVLAKAFQLDPMLAAGVILVGCAPGGTSSNVISYLARGDVALSVTMTSISTLLAPLMTPLLTQWLAGQYMPVDAGSMAMSIVRMVLVPVVGGLIVRVLFSGFVERILPAMPWVSVLGICYVVLAVVSKSATTILSAGLLVLLVVACHNVLGYLLGYGAGRILGRDARVCRTISIEVGMQNSGLAATLAGTYFSPEAALPGAVFSTWHNLSGAVLAAVYRRRDGAPAPAAPASPVDAQEGGTPAPSSPAD